MQQLSITSSQREEMIDVTSPVQEIISNSNLDSSFVICFVPHTTAGITINENADPDVTRDLLYKLAREIPQHDGYHHAEGNSDAHLKASLMGCSLQVMFENRRLILGRWQGIYFCEFDGPRHRKLIVEVGQLA